MKKFKVLAAATSCILAVAACKTMSGGSDLQETSISQLYGPNESGFVSKHWGTQFANLVSQSLASASNAQREIVGMLAAEEAGNYAAANSHMLDAQHALSVMQSKMLSLKKQAGQRVVNGERLVSGETYGLIENLEEFHESIDYLADEKSSPLTWIRGEIVELSINARLNQRARFAIRMRGIKRAYAEVLREMYQLQSILGEIEYDIIGGNTLSARRGTVYSFCVGVDACDLSIARLKTFAPRNSSVTAGIYTGEEEFRDGQLKLTMPKNKNFIIREQVEDRVFGLIKVQYDLRRGLASTASRSLPVRTGVMTVAESDVVSSPMDAWATQCNRVLAQAATEAARRGSNILFSVCQKPRLSIRGIKNSDLFEVSASGHVVIYEK